MKRKLILSLSIFLVLVFIFSLVACGKTYSDIKWPTTGIGSKLPKPESTKGEIISESENHFWVDVADTDKEAYNKYVEAVKEKGFTVDYSGGDTRYSAKDKEGNDVSIYYEDGNVMSISISAAEKETKGTKKETTKETTKEAKKETKAETKAKENDSNEVSPELKEMLDSYESFMDEYIDFMQKYKNSSDITSMLGEYQEYLTKYSDLMSKIQAVDESSLSTADANYYLEVTTRVLKKMSEAGVS